MDIHLKGATDGITAANLIRDGLEIPVVLVTAHTDEATFQHARITSPFGYVLKPFNDHELHTAIEVALDRHASEVRLKRTQQSLATVIESMGGVRRKRGSIFAISIRPL
jgi:AmiR/NasT family two-component response regulator